MSRPSNLADIPRRPPTARRRLLGGGLSLAVHLPILVALIWAWPSPPRSFDPRPVSVELVTERPLAPPKPPAPPKPLAASHRAAAAPPRRAVAQALPRRLVAAAPAPRKAAAPAKTDAPPTDAAAAGDAGASLSGAELAGAASAGEGSDGEGCNMARRVQDALRKDPLVRAALAQFSGKALLVWRGDWIQGQGEDGRGLAAVREAMMWEIAFAPAACRAEPMHGLVLLSLAGGGNPARLALGANAWRWSDLLTPRQDAEP
jgi:hypothetical protein